MDGFGALYITNTYKDLKLHDLSIGLHGMSLCLQTEFDL